jgi:hypothetical protein
MDGGVAYFPSGLLPDCMGALTAMGLAMKTDVQAQVCGRRETSSGFTLVELLRA